MDYAILAHVLDEVMQVLPEGKLRTEVDHLQAQAAIHRDHGSQYAFKLHQTGERWEDTPESFFVDMLSVAGCEADHRTLAYALGRALADSWGDQVRFSEDTSPGGHYCYNKGWFSTTSSEPAHTDTAA